MAKPRSTQLETLRAINSISPCTVVELAQLLDVPLSSARGRLAILRNAGLVAKTGTITLTGAMTFRLTDSGLAEVAP